MRSHGLGKTDSRGRLAFAQRGRRDRSYNDVVSIRSVLQPIADTEADLGLGASVEFEFFREDAGFFSDLFNGQQLRALRDFYVTGDLTGTCGAHVQTLYCRLRMNITPVRVY